MGSRASPWQLRVDIGIATLASIELLIVLACVRMTHARIGLALARTANRLGDGWMYPALACLFVLFAGVQSVPAIIIACISIVLLHCIYPKIKSIIKRARPFHSYPELKSPLPVLDEYSFPSGHVMTLTAALIPLILAY